LTLQTNKNFKTIVVDDCSPEPLLETIQPFGDALDLLYFRLDNNCGPGVARQVGMDWVFENNYEYIMFLDSDDMYYPNTVARLLHEIEQTGCDVVSSRIWREDESYGAPGEVIEASNETWLHGKIFSAKFLQESKINFPPMRTNEDMTFNLCVMETSQKVGLLDEILYLFKYEKNSITRDGFRYSMLTADFIVGMYYTVLYFRERGLTLTTQIIADVLGSYNHCQFAKFVGGLTEEHHQQVRYLLSQPEVQQALQDPSWYSTIINLNKLGNVLNNQVYWYEQTYIDWLREHME
jgi:glycosyltransferase involved in cell wall biosynthesis